MNATTLAVGLLGQLDRVQRLRAVRDALNKDDGWSNTQLIMLVIGVLALIGFALLMIHLRRRRAGGGDVGGRHSDYLTQAVRRLGLGRTELSDLRLVAARAKLPYPASVLLSPGNLAHAAHAAKQVDGDPALEQRLSALCEKLYGTQLPAWPPAKP